MPGTAAIIASRYKTGFSDVPWAEEGAQRERQGVRRGLKVLGKAHNAIKVGEHDGWVLVTCNVCVRRKFNRKWSHDL